MKTRYRLAILESLILILLISMESIFSLRNFYRSSIMTKKQNSISRVFLSNNNISPTKNMIICGDSTNESTYKKLFSSKIDDKSFNLADALITDPPYCLLERRRKGGDLRDPKAYKKKLDNDPTVTRFENVKQFTHFTKQWLDVAVKFVKPTAPLIIWTNALGKAPTIKLCNDLKYNFIGEFLWAKRTTLTTKQDSIISTKNEMLLRVYETALVFLPQSVSLPTQHLNDPSIPWSCISGYHDEVPVVQNISTNGSNTSNGGDTLSSSSSSSGSSTTFSTTSLTTDGSTVMRAHSHPCHKPYESMEALIRTWTKPNDIILDCFAGSGGIPIAAIRLGRVVRGVEVLPQWAEYSQQVLKEAEIKYNHSKGN